MEKVFVRVTELGQGEFILAQKAGFTLVNVLSVTAAYVALVCVIVVVCSVTYWSVERTTKK